MIQNRPGRIALGMIVTAAMACSDVPAVPASGPAPDAGAGVFADTIIAFTRSGTLVQCSPAAPSPECTQNPALGPSDGRTLALEPGGTLELALLGNVIVDRSGPQGNPLPDLKFWSTIAPGGRANVEVSFDGSSYEVLGVLNTSDETLDLAQIGKTMARFVRIVDQGQGQIAIDAVEAL